jgi:hypothetical protein
MRKLLDGPRRFINGRRGTFQLLFAFVYVIIGATLVLAEPTPSRLASLGWLGDLVPYVGYIWWIAAAVALTGVHKDRGDDSHSYAALTFTPIVFGGLFLIGLPFGGPLISGVTSVVIYWLIGFAVMVVSGMQGDNDRCTRTPHEP